MAWVLPSGPGLQQYGLFAAYSRSPFPSALFASVLNPKNKFCFPSWALSDRHWAADKAVLWELPAASSGSPLLQILSLSEWWRCLGPEGTPCTASLESSQGTWQCHVPVNIVSVCLLVCSLSNRDLPLTQTTATLWAQKGCDERPSQHFVPRKAKA